MFTLFKNKPLVHFSFLAHTAAMSSTCYNVFLYAWLNDIFRKELERILPCFPDSASGRAGQGVGATVTPAARLAVAATIDDQKRFKGEMSDNQAIQSAQVCHNNNSSSSSLFFLRGSIRPFPCFVYHVVVLVLRLELADLMGSAGSRMRMKKKKSLFCIVLPQRVPFFLFDCSASFVFFPLFYSSVLFVNLFTVS